MKRSLLEAMAIKFIIHFLRGAGQGFGLAFAALTLFLAFKIVKAHL